MITPEDVRAQSVKGVFDKVPDEGIERAIEEARLHYGSIKKRDATYKKVICLHAASILADELGLKNSYKARLKSLVTTLPR